jgi:hypothetical protein
LFAGVIESDNSLRMHKSNHSLLKTIKQNTNKGFLSLLHTTNLDLIDDCGDHGVGIFDIGFVAIQKIWNSELARVSEQQL